MPKLTAGEVWERVKRLEGQTVRSLLRNRPNVIETVTSKEVIIKARQSRPSREEIVSAYDTLWSKKELRIGRGDTDSFTYYIVHAILAAAIPEQIEVIPKTLEDDFSGIRLKENEKSANWKDHIVSTPDVLKGKPRIKGTRIPVSLILGYLAAGNSARDIMAEFPDLTEEQVAACLDYARELAEFEIVTA